LAFTTPGEIRMVITAISGGETMLEGKKAKLTSTLENGATLGRAQGRFLLYQLSNILNRNLSKRGSALGLP
jgi:hypothetical protein